jgi:type IV pilus assembly protein PilE
MKRLAGFTLIELMVVVAIMAILAAIAIPSFTEQVRKSRRTDAIQGLGDIQLKQERWRANHTTYGTGANIGLPTSQHYTFAITAASNTAAGYVATATPIAGSAQAGDSCGTYTFTMASGVLNKAAAGSRCY